MDKKVQKVNPDYKAIFTDIIFKKFGKVTEEFSFYLKKDTLSVLEIIDLNNKIFGVSSNHGTTSQKHRSYNKSDIFEILLYQQKHKLNNSELSKEFKISRNTITRWRGLYLCILFPKTA